MSTSRIIRWNTSTHIYEFSTDFGTTWAALALNGSIINEGTVAPARLGSGSSISTKFLRGDSSWQTVTSPSLPISLANGGTGVDLSASGGTHKILAQDASHVISARDFAAGDIVSGTIAPARLKTSQGHFRGLRLGTHPDADSAANKIQLLGLDEVSMSDGYSYSGLTLPLTSDITVSGASGLDTGSRVASTWYAAYLLGKSSTLAASDLNLIFHRAKDYKLDQSNTSTTTAGGLNATSSLQRLGQSFACGVSGICEFIDLSLSKSNSPVGRVWVTLEADSAGAPSGTPLATSDKLDTAKLATAQYTVRLAFRTPATLVSGTTYWIVIRCDYTTSGTNNVLVYANSPSSYAGGTEATWNGSTWSNIAADIYFKVYITENDTSITFPSGYDQSCLLGYVYNDSGNVLIPFIQRERYARYRLERALISSSATTAVLIDSSAFLPPVSLLAMLRFGGSTANVIGYYGGLPFGYDHTGATVSGAAEYDQTHRLIDASGTAFGAPYINSEPLPTEFQAVYFRVASNTGLLNVLGFQF